MNRYETISCVFNEEFLLPYYFKHYDFCDRFNILYDIDSTDNTLDILRNNPKVNLIPFEFPDGMDEALKIKFINYMHKKKKNKKNKWTHVRMIPMESQWSNMMCH